MRALWLCLCLLSCRAAAATQVLYVTHEPGRWHAYTPQLAALRELAAGAGWELTVASGSKEQTLDFLSNPEFGKGHDAIIYNVCLADSRDMQAMTSVIAQTEQRGIPALLLHCSMHSWWDSFKKGEPIPGNTLGKARANRRLLATWQASHPDKTLPAWGDFTGIASTGHGPKKSIELRPLSEHPATEKVPVGYRTVKTELYNNHYIAKEVRPLLEGVQGRESAIVMWEASRGNGRLIGLTLGHDLEEWQDPVFRGLVSASVDYLVGPP